ncbi:MAG TPA: glutamyl-tRNA reductase [Anaeromyxobacteraceae bacterium]|nr:glutamyl-tRNA reductase [Anaeromyxobacteraceae bacterium]
MLLVVGLNQKSAGVADRERLAVQREVMTQVVKGYAALGGVDELVLLSTCCRVEIYAATRCPSAAALALGQALADRAGPGAPPPFELHGEEALRHLLAVASSLESAVLGEPQILGQVKLAHQQAIEAGVSGKELNAVFERVYQVAKRVRTETDIGRASVSWGSAVATIAEKVLGPLASRRALVLGAGEMARVSAQHLRDEGATIVVSSRTRANAQALAAQVGGTERPSEELREELVLADLVVSAAPVAPEVLAPGEIAQAMKARRGRDLLLVDLAVPRALPAGLGTLEGVFLCDVDDLSQVTERAKAERTQALARARSIIAEEATRWRREKEERRAAPIIQALRLHASEIAREELHRTMQRIGADAEVESRLDAMAHALVSKLLHVPSLRLKEAGTAGAGGERLMAAAVEMFGLPCGRVPPSVG